MILTRTVDAFRLLSEGTIAIAAALAAIVGTSAAPALAGTTAYATTHPATAQATLASPPTSPTAAPRPRIELRGAPVNPTPYAVQQPDGSSLTVYPKGDAHLHWLEDKHGYSVVQAADKSWRFATGRDAQGKLVAGATRAGTTRADTNGATSRESTPPTGTRKHLVPDTGPAPSQVAMAPQGNGAGRTLVILVSFQDVVGRPGLRCQQQRLVLLPQCLQSQLPADPGGRVRRSGQHHPVVEVCRVQQFPRDRELVLDRGLRVQRKLHVDSAGGRLGHQRLDAGLLIVRQLGSGDRVGLDRQRVVMRCSAEPDGQDVPGTRSW